MHQSVEENHCYREILAQHQLQTGDQSTRFVKGSDLLLLFANSEDPIAKRIQTYTAATVETATSVNKFSLFLSFCEIDYHLVSATLN